MKQIQNISFKNLNTRLKNNVTHLIQSNNFFKNSSSK